jgi:small-conductance mechanosensitive channel
LFLGFGDSALNFEIYFWVSRPQVVLELKSEVALSIAAALTEAGIQVPVPRRDLHIIGLNQTNGTDQEITSESAERSERNQRTEKSHLK